MKTRPKTGQPRLHRLPMAIDALPIDVHRSIERLRGKYGLTWAEIERLSSLPFDEKWERTIGRSGFINWDALDPKVLEKFPDRRVPLTNLHRWYDVRVDQVHRDVTARAEQARILAGTFAKASLKGADEAVLNALRDLIFGMLQAGSDDGSKETAAKYLLALGEVMQEARKNTIREKVAAIEDRRVKQLERLNDQRIARMERETQSAAKKISKGEFGLDDINRLRERTFGLPPIQHA
jgi:hypothetical protein